MVREAGEKGCQFCRTIVSGIDRIEEAEGFPATLLKSHRLSIRHLKGGTVLIETKDKASRRLYELELYALEGWLQISKLLQYRCLRIYRFQQGEDLWRSQRCSTARFVGQNHDTSKEVDQRV